MKHLKEGKNNNKNKEHIPDINASSCHHCRYRLPLADPTIAIDHPTGCCTTWWYPPVHSQISHMDFK